MEFGIHNDYIPNYGVLWGLKQPFYLFDPCEENYKYAYFITEMGSFITSFFLFLPYIYIYMSKPERFHYETRMIAWDLVYSGFASMAYHGYVCYFTQFFDMLTIIWTIMHVINFLNIPFTQKEEFIIVMMFFFGMFHPLLTAFSMIYLIFKCCSFFMKIGFSKGRYISIVPVSLIILSFSLIILDIITCPYQFFRYFHAIWHFTAFLAFCFMLNDIEYVLKTNKELKNTL